MHDRSDRYSTNVSRYGTDEPLAAQIALQAGPFSLIYEAGDLRYVRVGEHEIVRRIYAAVRDHNWGTTPSTLSNVDVHHDSDSFRISYDSTHQQNEIDFVWHGTIIGSSDGTITFTFDGRARSTFGRNRIGFCVLVPAACAGVAGVVEHLDGSQEQTTLPTLVVADQPVLPFNDLRVLRYEVIPGVWASVRLEGDAFEMEDQRNWTDASFKIFCTPLSLPYPVEIAAGTTIQQRIIVSLRDERVPSSDARRPSTASGAAPVTIYTDVGQPANPRPLPAIGLGVASDDEPLSQRAIEHLRALHLTHLRIEVPSGAHNTEEQIRRASNDAHQLGVSLEVALLLDDEPDADLHQLRQQIEQIEAPVGRWLIYPLQERLRGGAPTDRLVERARHYLGSYNPNAQFGAGTNSDFIFLRRNVPSVKQIDVLTCAINPQVHAFDNASLVETLAAQATIVNNMRQLAPMLPLIISPVTLKPRFNPYATGPAPAQNPHELPPQVDVRQLSLFGAAWTLGSLKYLAEAETAGVTFYETQGWRGVMETEHGSPLPERFPSVPGAVFPLYHVLADVGEFAGGTVMPTRSSDALLVESLLLHKNHRTRLLLANMTNDARQVTVPQWGERMQVRVLDETTALYAMQHPALHRAQRQSVVHRDGWTLTLRPYAVVCIDDGGLP